MKQNTMLIGAFVAGLATTYALQKTKVFGSETRIFGADCNSQGYETNAPNGYTGNAAILTKSGWNGTQVDFTQDCESNATNDPTWYGTYCVNGKRAELSYGGTGSDAGEVSLHSAKGLAVGKDPTGYWIDKTVAANIAECTPLCPPCADPEPCPACPPTPTCAEPECPEPEPCPECPDCSKQSKHPSGEPAIQPPMGFMERFFGRRRA